MDHSMLQAGTMPIQTASSPRTAEKNWRHSLEPEVYLQFQVISDHDGKQKDISKVAVMSHVLRSLNTRPSFSDRFLPFVEVNQCASSSFLMGGKESGSVADASGHQKEAPALISKRRQDAYRYRDDLGEEYFCPLKSEGRSQDELSRSERSRGCSSRPPSCHEHGRARPPQRQRSRSLEILPRSDQRVGQQNFDRWANDGCDQYRRRSIGHTIRAKSIDARSGSYLRPLESQAAPRNDATQCAPYKVDRDHISVSDHGDTRPRRRRRADVLSKSDHGVEVPSRLRATADSCVQCGPSKTTHISGRRREDSANWGSRQLVNQHEPSDQSKCEKNLLSSCTRSDNITTISKPAGPLPSRPPPIQGRHRSEGSAVNASRRRRGSGFQQHRASASSRAIRQSQDDQRIRDNRRPSDGCTLQAWWNDDDEDSDEVDRKVRTGSMHMLQSGPASDGERLHASHVEASDAAICGRSCRRSLSPSRNSSITGSDNHRWSLPSRSLQTSPPMPVRAPEYVARLGDEPLLPTDTLPEPSLTANDTQYQLNESVYHYNEHQLVKRQQQLDGQGKRDSTILSGPGPIRTISRVQPAGPWPSRPLPRQGRHRSEGSVMKSSSQKHRDNGLQRSSASVMHSSQDDQHLRSTRRVSDGCTLLAWSEYAETSDEANHEDLSSSATRDGERSPVSTVVVTTGTNSDWCQGQYCRTLSPGTEHNKTITVASKPAGPWPSGPLPRQGRHQSEGSAMDASRKRDNGLQRHQACSSNAVLRSQDDQHLPGKNRQVSDGCTVLAWWSEDDGDNDDGLYLKGRPGSMDMLQSRAASDGERPQAPGFTLPGVVTDGRKDYKCDRSVVPCTEFASTTNSCKSGGPWPSRPLPRQGRHRSEGNGARSASQRKKGLQRHRSSAPIAILRSQDEPYVNGNRRASDGCEPNTAVWGLREEEYGGVDDIDCSFRTGCGDIIQPQKSETARRRQSRGAVTASRRKSRQSLTPPKRINGSGRRCNSRDSRRRRSYTPPRRKSGDGVLVGDDQRPPDCDGNNPVVAAGDLSRVVADLRAKVHAHEKEEEKLAMEVKALRESLTVRRKVLASTVATARPRSNSDCKGNRPARVCVGDKAIEAHILMAAPARGQSSDNNGNKKSVNADRDEGLTGKNDISGTGASRGIAPVLKKFKQIRNSTVFHNMAQAGKKVLGKDSRPERQGSDVGLHTNTTISASFSVASDYCDSDIESSDDEVQMPAPTDSLLAPIGPLIMSNQ